MLGDFGKQAVGDCSRWMVVDVDMFRALTWDQSQWLVLPAAISILSLSGE